MNSAAQSTTMTPVLWTMLIALSIIWGGSFFFNGVLVKELPPLTIVFARVALAALALHVWLAITGASLTSTKPLWLTFAVMGLLNNVIPFSLIVLGQTQVASSVASILNATTPIFTLLVAHFATRDEKIGSLKALGIATGFFGVFVMLGGLGTSGDTPIYAYIACLGAALSYGFAGVFGRRFRALGVEPKHVAVGQLTASSVMMLPMMLIIDQPWALAMPSAASWAAIFGLAIVCTSFAYLLFFRVLSEAGATNVSLVTFLVPPSAIVLGVLVLGEVLEPRHLIGMALIGAGLVLVDGRLLRRLR